MRDPGLARSTGGSPYSVHEVIRWMLDEAACAETWVFAIVVETLQSLRRCYGQKAFVSLGGEVALRSYGGISVNVTLTPVAWNPGSVTRTIRAEALSLPAGVQRQRLLRTIAFLDHGKPSKGRGRD